MVQHEWFSGNWYGLWMLMSFGLLCFSLLCFWKHRRVSGARLWFHVAHALSLAAYCIRHALYLADDNQNTTGGMVLVRFAYATEAVLFTCAILHFNSTIQTQSALLKALPRACWWFNVAWCTYNILLVVLYLSCTKVGDSRIACIQQRGQPQADTLIRAIIWLGLGVLMAIVGVKWIRFHKDKIESLASVLMLALGATLIIGGCLFRGVLWLVLCANSFNSSFTDVYLSDFDYNLAGFVLPVLVPATALSSVLWAPTVILVDSQSDSDCRSFLAQASVPLLETDHSSAFDEGGGCDHSMHQQTCGLHSAGGALEAVDMVHTLRHTMTDTLCLDEEMTFNRTHEQVVQQLLQFRLQSCATRLSHLRTQIELLQSTEMHCSRASTSTAIASSEVMAFRASLASQLETAAADAAKHHEWLLSVFRRPKCLEQCSAGTDRVWIKPSRSKKLNSVSLYPTNLNTYSVSAGNSTAGQHMELAKSMPALAHEVGSEYHTDQVHHSDLSSPQEGLHTRERQETVYFEFEDCSDALAIHAQNNYRTVCVGAPAAHALGFKDGGCWKLEQKLEQLNQRICGALDSDEIQAEAMEVAVRSEILQAELSQRLDLCLPQAYSVAVVAVLQALSGIQSTSDCEELQQRGLLLMVGSLLSTFGSETGMLQDMVSAVRSIATVEIAFVVAPAETSEPLVQFTTANRVVLALPPSSHHSAWLVAAFPEGKYLRVVPVLFSVGVNENQSIANYTSSGDLTLERDINAQGLADLRRYCQGCGGEVPAVLSELAELVNGDSYKRVEILSASARCALLVGGARWLSCKSGKDRTGMMCTLEAVEVCCGQEASAVQQQYLDKLRFGLRLQNCLINIQKAAYAFNSLQVKTLPKRLVPPKGTYGQGGAS